MRCCCSGGIGAAKIKGRTPDRAGAQCVCDELTTNRSRRIVPVLSSAPRPTRSLRTLDLFGLTLELAGISLDEYEESDASRLARGTWRPDVWR